MSIWDDNPDPLYPVLTTFSPPSTPQPPTPPPTLPETQHGLPFTDPFRTPRPIPTILTPHSHARPVGHFIDEPSVEIGPPLASSDDELLPPIMATLGPKMGAAVPFPRSITRPKRPPVLPLSSSSFTAVWAYEQSSGSISPRTRATPPGTPRRHTHDRACGRKRAALARRGSTGTFGSITRPRHDDEHSASPPTSANLRRTASSSGYSRWSPRRGEMRIPSGPTLAAPIPVRLGSSAGTPIPIDLWASSDDDVRMETLRRGSQSTPSGGSAMLVDVDLTDFETTSHDLESVLGRIRPRTSLSGYDGDSDDDSAIGHAENVQLLSNTRCFVSSAKAERLEPMTTTPTSRTSPRRVPKVAKPVAGASGAPPAAPALDSVATAALFPTPVAALDVDLSLSGRPTTHVGRWRSAPVVRVPVAVSGRKDLSPRRKAQLLRRTRKIESILGKSLSEEEVEQYVVEPSLATTTVITRIDQNAWPVETLTNLPEWARDDCVPRRDSSIDAQAAWQLALAMGHRRSRSGLARIRDLLSIQGEAPPSRIAVALTRETRVAETHDRRYSNKPSVNRSPFDGPPSPDTPLSPASLFDDPAAVARRHRRAQLVKLQRLLGESPYTLGLCDDKLASVSPRRISARAARATASDTHLMPTTSASGGVSPRSRLVSRLRAKAMPVRGGVAMERDFPPPGWHESNHMSAAEKTAAVRRASKLEHMFGHMPPHDLILPARREVAAAPAAVAPTSSSAPTSPPASPVFTGYRESIQSLIYLVEHDQERLAHIVDELDAAVAPRATSVAFDRRASMPPGLLSPRSALTLTPTSPAVPAAPPCTPATATPTQTTGHAFGRAHQRARSLSHTASSTSTIAAPTAKTAGAVDGDTTDVTTDTTDTTDAATDATCETPVPSAHAVARARTRKLSDFFGEPVDAAHGHGHPHVPDPRPFAHSAAHAHALLSAEDAATVVGCAGPPRFRPYPLLQGRPAAAARRRQTLDGVLRELWDNVQSEAERGRLAPAEVRRLGDLWGMLGHKRAVSGTWAEL